MRRMLGVIDEAAAKATTRPARPVRISVDEWNIRHYRDGKLERRDPRQVQDAVFAAGTLNAMVRLSPRVAMANYVFLVNGNGTMIVGPDRVVKTPLYHVFREYGRRVRGKAVEVRYDGPVVTPPAPRAGAPVPAGAPPLHGVADYRPGPAPVVDSVASVGEDGTVTVVLVNRHGTDAAEVALGLPAGYAIRTSWTLADEDAYAANDLKNPERVVPVERAVNEPGVASWRCAPRSVVMLVCGKGG
jgi:alpha-N-arabinofuranosidase